MIPTFAPAFSLPGLHLENFCIPTDFISKTLVKDRQSVQNGDGGKKKTAK
jgi:hypothetical protein